LEDQVGEGNGEGNQPRDLRGLAAMPERGDGLVFQICREVPKHESVDHSKYEWARGDVHVNTLEGFFSVFKRGLIGVYQHVDTKHFSRYLAEFDFRQNTRARLGVDDVQRAAIAVRGAKGKRLFYRQPT
jgi:hypothetical protein